MVIDHDRCPLHKGKRLWTYSFSNSLETFHPLWCFVEKVQSFASIFAIIYESSSNIRPFRESFKGVRDDPWRSQLLKVRQRGQSISKREVPLQGRKKSSEVSISVLRWDFIHTADILDKVLKSSSNKQLLVNVYFWSVAIDSCFIRSVKVDRICQRFLCVLLCPWIWKDFFSSKRSLSRAHDLKDKKKGTVK